MTDPMRPRPVRVACERVGTTLTAYLDGELDLTRVVAVNECLDGHLAGVETLVLNLADVTVCDTDARRMLVVLHLEMQERGGALALQDPPPRLRAMLETMGLIPVIPIQESPGSDGSSTGLPGGVSRQLVV